MIDQPSPEDAEERTEARSPESQPASKPVVTYDDFAKLDLRVGTILEAAEHPNADRLLVLKVDLGKETRQIIAGIRGDYAPEGLVGRQIVVVANLAPRKMRGLESQGMLIAAVVRQPGQDKSDVVILTTEKNTPPGTPCS
jgi:methionine--tRNA ligase beta chain